jgi:serine/threonine protein kinase
MTGASLGPYRILEELGSGGMGTVYRAHDARLQRSVAIKVLDEHEEDAARRLLREARAASALSHPNVCVIHEVGEDTGRAFIVMELVEGRSLRELIPAEGLPLEGVVRYGVQIADALAHAHERGILHRDLKSANVVITPEGRAKVLDFGLAARLPQAEAEAVTRTQETLADAGVVAGTLAYMAPELLRCGPATPRSDIWALGVLLYEMTSGRLPFDGASAADLTAAILKDEPVELGPEAHAGLVAIARQALAKEAGHRYGTASEVRAALQALSPSAVGLTTPAASGPASRCWRSTVWTRPSRHSGASCRSPRMKLWRVPAWWVCSCAGIAGTRHSISSATSSGGRPEGSSPAVRRGRTL